MKKLSIFLVIIMLFSLSGCARKNHKKIIKEAVEELKTQWEEVYEESKYDHDGHFEIKNTRIITIKENNEKTLKNVSYIVEFEIFTDSKGTAPYYTPTRTYNSVVVYDDGKMEVKERNILTSAFYISKNGYNYSKVIESVDDYGDKYNCEEKLK